MNGADALKGYVYQQQFVAFRMLSSEARRLLTEQSAERCIRRFAIEGCSTSAGPAWDVRFELEDGEVHSLECKDTTITRDDRIDFYRRIRKEIAQGTPCEGLHVGWVTDLEKQAGRILQHFAVMKDLAREGVDVDWQSCPTRVSSGEEALREALYHLCTHDRREAEPPVDIGDAHDLLGRVLVHPHRHRELSRSVQLLAAGLFASGTGKAIHEFIMGNLSKRIAEEGSVQYDRDTFIAAAGTGPLALSASGVLRDILNSHSAAVASPEIACISWERLRDQPRKIWPLAERLPSLPSRRSCLIAAQAGVGKTVTSWQLFNARRNDSEAHHVLRFDAASINDGVLRSLPRLLCVLCGVGPTWMVIDGLDEISPDAATPWRKTLYRLAALPSLPMVLTVREEVLSAHDWLQQLVSPFEQITLPPLQMDQVELAFQDVGLAAPQAGPLLECLRNPFLLSLYARMASPEDLPLRTSGEVTGFHIIERYWNRRVLSESQGLRGSEAAGRASNLKRLAVGYLQDHALNGALVISRRQASPEEAQGIDVLRREGVLQSHSTNAVSWSHDWLRQYAIVDRLVETIDVASPTRLAASVAGVGVDPVRRVASVAAVKWILVHREWGPVEHFLGDLHARRPELASEALPVLAEGPAGFLAVDELPVPVMVEFVEVAVRLHAEQFADQIRGLEPNRFAGACGAELLDAVTRFEQEVLVDG